MLRLFRKYNGLLAQTPTEVTQLLLRLGLATPFFLSGLTRWDGFALSTGAKYVFTEEFRLHLFGLMVPFPFPLATAWIVSAAEIVLPILLVLGVLTRFVALAMLVMTAVIQLTVPEGWAIHITWAAMALALVAYGGGPWAVDSLLPAPPAGRRERRSARKQISMRGKRGDA
ncbi:DoxX family protein [Prosthecomicrobium sp. N25]|uniref:DoxX family protein n=1 Tax=Prosthecomicrobium sp. N25 TaxID=3129254 RepID=UPI0030771CF2